jgi:DNA-binding transcriptional MerR regulator
MTQRPTSILEFELRPPNRGQMWSNLALTIRQAAAVTGVSPRQIQHWLDRGYLVPSVKGTRRISGNALDLICLIHQARLAGIPLRRAVPLAEEFLAEVMSDPLAQMDIGQEVITDLENKIRAARVAIDEVGQVLEQVDRTSGEKQLTTSAKS